MSDIKLTYFDFNGGRGEEVRLALHAAGVAFEDNRIDGRKDWGALKPTTTWGNLPVLEIDGEALGQSNAILTYVGRTGDLHPTNLFEAARHDAILNSVEQLRHDIATTGDKDEEAKKAKREAFAAGALATWAAGVEGQVRGPFLAGDKLNVADIKLYVILSFLKRGGLDHVPFSALDAFPKLQALHAAVHADSRIADWNNAH